MVPQVEVKGQNLFDLSGPVVSLMSICLDSVLL